MCMKELNTKNKNKNGDLIMKKTLAQEANHNFDDGSFIICDDNGNEIYIENSTGYWVKHVFDENGNVICHKDSTGYCSKREFGKNGFVIGFSCYK